MKKFISTFWKPIVFGLVSAYAMYMLVSWLMFFYNKYLLNKYLLQNVSVEGTMFGVIYHIVAFILWLLPFLTGIIIAIIFVPKSEQSS